MKLHREGSAINKATPSSFDPASEAYCEKHREYGEMPLSATVKPSIHQIVASCNSLWVCWIYRPDPPGRSLVGHFLGGHLPKGQEMVCGKTFILRSLNIKRF